MKVDYKTESTTKCRICGKLLKLNVVNRNSNATLCYVCFNVEKGVTIRISKRCRNNIEREKVINFIEKQKENIKKYKK